jgi:type IV secretion system protein VirB9
LGRTGAGKSFLLNFLITNLQKYEPHTFIFDLGGSFESLTQLFGGSYVSAGEAEAYKKELETLRAETAEQLHAAQVQNGEQVSRFRSSYATKLQFDYLLDTKAARDPFLVSAIYHDDTFTYIKCAAREKPALYEMKDGKPNLTNFQLENGVYIVPKILDSGYLTIGKKKLPFTRRSSAK